MTNENKQLANYSQIGGPALKFIECDSKTASINLDELGHYIGEIKSQAEQRAREEVVMDILENKFWSPINDFDHAYVVLVEDIESYVKSQGINIAK